MSARARLLRLALRVLARPLLARTISPVNARRRFQRAARMLFRAPPLSLLLPSAAGLPGLWVQNQAKGEGLVLYFHGGGYIVGAPETHAAMLAELMRLSGQRALLPLYRLAPEHPFPAAFDDALAAWQALRVRGYSPDQIILGGDSAGGGLALALLSHLCIAGQPPAGAFVFSPWTDLTFSGDSIRENAASEQMLPAERLAEGPPWLRARPIPPTRAFRRFGPGFPVRRRFWSMLPKPSFCAMTVCGCRARCHMPKSVWRAICRMPGRSFSTICPRRATRLP